MVTRVYFPPCRLLGGTGGVDRHREPQGESDGAGGQHLVRPAGGAGEDPAGGAAGVREEPRQVDRQTLAPRHKAHRQTSTPLSTVEMSMRYNHRSCHQNQMVTLKFS